MSDKLESIKEKVFPEWKKSKLESYVEPTRRGVPKGTPIGLSTAKYQCALYMVFSRYESPKEASLISDKSPLMIAKWKTEQLFKNEVKKLSREFAEYVTELLVKNRDIGIKSLEVLKDFHLYNKQVRSEVIGTLESGIKGIKKDKQKMDKEEYVESIIFLGIFKWALTCRDRLSRPADSEMFRELIKMEMNVLQDMQSNLENASDPETSNLRNALESTYTFLLSYLL